jgi:polyketide biosynthesis 3-hydroxy-3-methylglutaryl-CoA synthase-like enzyme PksG
MALNFILSQTSPGAKALIVATDISRFIATEGGELLTNDWSYFEPSAGAGAVAILVSDNPKVLQVDVGANGYYGYEVMDTCRPVPDSESGDVDLSMMSYLDCCEKAFIEYHRRVTDVDYQNTFDYLAFHTPFGGMVKGAHRMMMRKFTQAKLNDIELDFNRRVALGLRYCQRVGNIMGGTIMLSLSSTIDSGDFTTPKRVGCFSYGSGCCSEFYSGVVTASGQQWQRQFEIAAMLNRRYRLSIAEYEDLFQSNRSVQFGTRNVTLDPTTIAGVRSAWQDRPLLTLREIREFHREYEWVS